MATFYIQLENKLLQISGELTAENISKALGYVPVSPNATNELSQRVDNITFDSLKDNPFLLDGSGELNIVDEYGNIIAKIDVEGIHSVDFIAGTHKLTDKIDSSALNGYAKESWVTAEITKAATEGKVDLTGYATEQWVEDKNYLTDHQDISHLATKEEVVDVDFFDIKNNPIINAEEGNLIFVDESGNIGLKLDSDNNLTVKDVIAGDNILSNKVDKENGKGLSTEDFTTALKNKLQSLNNYDDTSITEAVNSLRADFDTLVSGDTSTAIKTFNEIIAFLEGVEDTESLSGIIASIEQQIANIEIPSLAGYATEDYVNQKEKAIQTWVNNKEFATQEDVANIDFYEIKDNPIVNDGDGKLIFADENGNIGLQLEADNTLYVKDVIAGDNILSNKADKSDLEGLATESYVVTKIAEAKLEGSDITIPVKDVKVNGQTVIKDMIADIDLTPYAKSEDVPSIEGLATEQWVTDKNYLTQHQDISHLADKSELPTKVSELENDSKFITIDDISEITVPTKTSELTNDSGFITINDVPVLEIPEEYVTETELNDKGFLTEHQEISHLASRNWVESQGYAHQEDLLEISFNDIQDSPISIDDSGMINFVDESGNVGFQINEEGLRVTDVIAGEHKLSQKANASDIPNLDGYAKTEDIPSVDGFVKSEDLPNFGEFAKTDDIPSLYGYATQQWVNEQEFAHQDDLLNMSFNDIQDSPITENNDGEVNIVDENGNIALKVNDEGLYVKDVIAGDHILSNKADTSYVDEAIAGIVDGAPETLDTLNELAAALNDNADIVDVLNQSISNKQDAITDLEIIRQGAAKGATALQSYTEQYKGTVTGVNIDGTTKNPSSGVVDLGYINKQLSTSTSSSMTLSPNIYYRNTSTSLSSLTITLGSVSNSNIINEYFVEFTTSSSGTTVSLPSTIKWANGESPTFEVSTTYQISIVNDLGVVTKFK